MGSERRVELTSSAWLFQPEGLFAVAGKINKDRPINEQIAVELYPVHYFNGLPLGPGRINEDKIRSWQREYGSVPVERIHLPFHYSLPLAFKNYFYTSVFKEPGSLKDRVIASAVSAMTTTVQNRFATRMAGNLEAGLNAHVNIIEEAGKRGSLAKIRGGAKYIWVENDLDYPRKRPKQIEKERDPRRPLEVVKKYGLEGVIMGVDHAYRAGVDPYRDFIDLEGEFKKHLRTLHLSGTKGDHGLIEKDDVDFWDFMNFVKGKISEDVRFCLDLNPFEMGKKTRDEQIDYVRDLVKELEK